MKLIYENLVIEIEYKELAYYKVMWEALVKKKPNKQHVEMHD